MSKKRKTRKQKEAAHLRHVEEVKHVHVAVSPTYKITIPQNTEAKQEEAPIKSLDTIEKRDIEYLKHDITAITAASGIVVAFDILLFVILSSGFLRLHFLGY